jgi:hypothetical protein
MRLTSLFLTVVLTACSSGKPNASGADYTSSKDTYLKYVSGQSTTFNISTNENRAAWNRALEFLKNYSAKAPVVKTESLLETPKNKIIGDFYYRISRTTYGQNIQYSVDCLGQGMGMDQLAQRNKFVLADYIRTGELPYPGLITK